MFGTVVELSLWALTFDIGGLGFTYWPSFLLMVPEEVAGDGSSGCIPATHIRDTD